jgi:hypothetical protein
MKSVIVLLIFNFTLAHHSLAGNGSGTMSIVGSSFSSNLEFDPRISDSNLVYFLKFSESSNLVEFYQKDSLGKTELLEMNISDLNLQLVEALNNSAETRRWEKTDFYSSLDK